MKAKPDGKAMLLFKSTGPLVKAETIIARNIGKVDPLKITKAELLLNQAKARRA